MSRPKSTASALALLGAVLVSWVATLVLLRVTATAPEVAGLGFGFGPLIGTLAEEGVYADCLGPACARAHRMPALPTLLAALARVVGPETAPVAVARSALVAPWAVLALWLGARRSRGAPWAARSALVAGVLLCPPWLVHTLLPVPEESLLNPLAAAITAVLLWGRGRPAALGLGLLVGLLVLTKSGLWPLGAILCVGAHVRLGGWRGAWPSWLALALAALGWSAWVASTGGPFAPVTSLDGWNLHKGNNPRVLEVYPAHSLDRLSPWLAAQAPTSVAESEWAAHRYHAAQGLRFWRERPGLALRGTLVKAWAFFARVELPSAQEPAWRRVASWLSLPFLIGFRLLLAAVLWRALRTLGSKPRCLDPWLLLAAVAAYALPAIVGFAYERHALVLLAPTALLALHRLEQRSPVNEAPAPPLQ
ncbi:MAG TPA: hypothetical protein VMV46_16630 [Thermoanaerobaculia bacterium]|nr:hypothetical protein [Thermoanaerobaculia bacterium]